MVELEIWKMWVLGIFAGIGAIMVFLLICGILFQIGAWIYGKIEEYQQGYLKYKEFYLAHYKEYETSTEEKSKEKKPEDDESEVIYLYKIGDSAVKGEEENLRYWKEHYSSCPHCKSRKILYRFSTQETFIQCKKCKKILFEESCYD